MTPSQKCIDIIKRFEGCRLEPYKDPVGIWTVGFGHTGGVVPGCKITTDEAESLLVNDLTKVGSEIEKILKVQINQNEFDALCSFAFNVGVGNLKKSTLLRHVNANEPQLAAGEFNEWVHAGDRILPGLIRRREAERQLFISPIDLKV